VRHPRVLLSGARDGSIALLVYGLALISGSAFVSGINIISAGAFFVSGLGLDLRLPPG
jgi:hypothetical protein